MEEPSQNIGIYIARSPGNLVLYYVNIPCCAHDHLSQDGTQLRMGNSKTQATAWDLKLYTCDGMQLRNKQNGWDIAQCERFLGSGNGIEWLFFSMAFKILKCMDPAADMAWARL